MSKAANGEPYRYYLIHRDDESDECFPWPYSKRGGYGDVSIAGRQYKVHALACEYAHGPRPQGMLAIHGPCALPKECWNWRHMQWGTPKQNQLDRHRDRVAWGRGENLSKILTDANVLVILNGWAHGATQTALAHQFGVKPNTINGIITGKTWAHLPRPDVPGVTWGSGGKIRTRAKLTDATAQEILVRFAAGEPYKRLAEEYGVRAHTVNALINGYTWSHLPRPSRADGVEWRRGGPRLSREQLTDATATEILARYAAGERTPRALAAEFGVHRESIRVLVAGMTWKHLPRP